MNATMTKAERREKIDDLKSERDEINADLPGLYTELDEIREKIAAAKARRAAIREELAELRTK
jgi:uncharacterized coiled-coil DUF342 family protein